MKKILSTLAGFILIVILTACNQTAKPVNESAPETNDESAVAEKPIELTLEEVIKKSTEANNNLKSFAVKMNVDQHMTSSDQDEMNMETQSDIEMNVVLNPMAFHQKISMTLGEEAFVTESYFSEQGMFFLEPSGQQWMKFPQEMTDAFLQMSGQQSNPIEELKKLQKFVDDFTFEQDETNYILTLKAAGDEFSEFIKELATEALPTEMAQEDMMNSMKINSIKYKFLIDKESFYPVSLDMEMDMEINAEDQTIVMKQKMSGNYTKHNQVDAITVPQNVIDSAVEMEM